MLKSLKYNIQFSSTGKKFSQDIQFQPGLTVITGANENGKSLILEMIEYAWFGAGALRGQASDYDLLEVDMVWETRGETFTVSRHGAVQNLNKTKAVGAKAVNLEILKILGIDLDVFRISCSAKQGELDKLTARMRPTERRKMVDEVIGLNGLEIVEKLCRTEGNSAKRLRDDLAKRIVEPIEPEKPSDYIPSDFLDKLYKEYVHVDAERRQLERVVKPTLPSEPIKGEFNEDVVIYESVRQNREAERAGIERTLRTIPAATFTRQDIADAEAYYEQAGRGPVPVYKRSQLETWLDCWDKIDQQSHSVECPNCHTQFIPGEGTVEKVDTPPLTRAQIKTENRKVEAWEGFMWVDLPEPKLRQSEIKDAVRGLDQADIRLDLEKQLQAIPLMESRESELKLLRSYEQECRLYEDRLERYVESLAAWADAQERLTQLPQTDDDIENKLRQAQVYEEQKRTYDANMVSFIAASGEIDDLNKRAEAFHNGAEALKFVRSQVKQHLVPSLNKVASHLLKEMTNGARTQISVDEEFEVTVDGQPVRTLSGSGVSVVNLALRIALGQVLTQRVLPIFLADEIDHDMDEERAAATHAAVKNLSKTLSQILVVSHKHVEGDNYIGV